MDTVDLQEPIFFDFFLFHVKPSIAILTTVSKKTFVKYRSNRELFTKKGIFEQSVNQPKVSFAANTLVLGIQSRKHLLISVARGDLCYLSAYNTRLNGESEKRRRVPKQKFTRSLAKDIFKKFDEEGEKIPPWWIRGLRLDIWLVNVNKFYCGGFSRF